MMVLCSSLDDAVPLTVLQHPVFLAVEHYCALNGSNSLTVFVCKLCCVVCDATSFRHGTSNMVDRAPGDPTHWLAVSSSISTWVCENMFLLGFLYLTVVTIRDHNLFRLWKIFIGNAER